MNSGGQRERRPSGITSLVAVSSILALSLLLAGCYSAQEPTDVIFNSTPCDFRHWEEAVALPVLFPGCVIVGGVADFLTGYPRQPKYETGAYVATSDDGGGGFWGGEGPHHLGGGFVERGPEGNTYVDPPLFP